MQNALRQLGRMVQVFRAGKGLTQSELAEHTTPPVSRTAIAHLEQGRRLPDVGTLERVCRSLGIPEFYWQPLLDDDNRRIAEFEDILGELVGTPVSLQDVDGDTVKAARGEILTLLDRDLTTEQTYDTFRSLLVYYGVHPPSKPFFDKYFDADSFRTAHAFRKAVATYQRDAI